MVNQFINIKVLISAFQFILIVFSVHFIYSKKSAYFTRSCSQRMRSICFSNIISSVILYSLVRIFDVILDLLLAMMKTYRELTVINYKTEYSIKKCLDFN